MKRYLRYAILFVLVAFIVSGASLAWFLYSPVVLAGEGPFTVKIRRGMSFNAIVEVMKQQGFITNETKLRFSAAVLGVRDKMKAGKYEIKSGISSHELLRQLADGRVAVERVTIPEGKHARQIASILQKKLEMDSTDFVRLVEDEEFIRELGFDVPSLEGFLFPDTYGFYWGISPSTVITRFVTEFRKRFDDSLRARTRELDLSIHTVLTLASIIEGEAVVAEEREIISAVYWNRLRKGMLLQADPTIQYVIPDGPRRLLNRDLQVDSPYNTYKYPGLPPGPINNPGIHSIRAALFPAEVDYLYFVANGDGSHTFSRTLREHLRAKAKFDRVRRKVAAQKKTEG